uniref:Uncharacterized protein n=1 Tax=Physcomitrium patens TaxID=3218 RepID=A0A2K1JRV9_PHYPA|nr:hypothetical protein PHYPA_016653 [Physcomitrium patens]
MSVCFVDCGGVLRSRWVCTQIFIRCQGRAAQLRDLPEGVRILCNGDIEGRCAQFGERALSCVIFLLNPCPGDLDAGVFCLLG